MSLELPDLDDRSYEELLTDARKRIPVHAPAWTDHNAHDPGITILELLAWVAETHTYELDQVTDAHRRKYLELVDIEPRPPTPATVELSLSIEGATAETTDARATRDPLDGHDIPAGTALLAGTDPDHRQHFRTTHDLVFTAARIATVLVDHEGDISDHSRANGRSGLHYRPFGPDPSAGDACYLGFDADPFAGGRLELGVDFHEANLPAPASHGDEAVSFEPSVRCVWEHCTHPGQWYSRDGWASLAPDHDETRSLYRGGRISLPRPAGWRDNPATIAEHDEPRYWIRCRLAAPTSARTGDPHYEVPPQVNAIRPNVVRAVHERPVSDERLGTDDGRDRTTSEPHQRFHLDAAPVQAATVRVGGESWQLVDDFAAASPDDRVAVLDRAEGTVTFGDGRRGRIPEPGQPVRADYVAGGGTAGNLSAETDWQFTTTSRERIKISAPEPPRGGRAAEPVADALARARAQRTVPYRAVTAADYAFLATHTPGLRFGRAAVASAPGRGAPVTVVVVPYSPPERLPVPSEGFRAAVERHLCRHSLLTERVSVVGPTYVPIHLQVVIEPVEESEPTSVRRAVAEALETFLDPLEGYDGEGWPFGRPVYRSEVYERLEVMEQVADAVDVDVSTAGTTRIADHGETLPNLVRTDVTISEDRRQCGRDD